MILTSALPVPAGAVEAPVTVRLIGALDRVLIDSLRASCESFAESGGRTLIVLVRDLIAMRDEHLDRFLALLEAFRTAGNRVCIEATPTWRRIVRGLGTRFESSTSLDERRARRQLIICHSLDRRPGAA